MSKQLNWAFFVQLGNNMWSDPAEKDGIHAFPGQPENVMAADYMRFDENLWREMSAKLQHVGANMVVLDLGEGLQYESHPELAVRGSWSKEKLSAELSRLRGMGLEVIPKLNFSTCHDQWMGEYSRMVSTKAYYAFCRDIIAEVCELFDHPRFFHIGMDEEGIDCQRKYNYVVIRQGELWWHDFNFLADCVRAGGSRPWIWCPWVWADHLLQQENFLQKMPQDVLISGWYYGDFKTPQDNARLEMYSLLDKAGFDQIPTGSTWTNDENFPGTVKYCNEIIAPERLLGYLQAPWFPVLEQYREKQLAAIDIMAEAIAL